jgi:MFS family permease
MAAQGPAGQKLGSVRLADGVTRRAMATFYYAAIFSTGLMAFMNFVQPFVLAEILKVPPGQQGAASGNLGFFSELVIIAFVGLAGLLSDRVGRRPIYALGFVVMAAAYVLYPWADGLGELTLYRGLFAVGAACVTAMLGTVIADYPVEADRGKATGMMGVMNGLGILITLFLLAKLPAMLVHRGVEAATAGRITYGVVAGLCVITAVVIVRGLVKGRPAGAGAHRSFGQLAREGLRAGRDPGVALAYGAAFVSRGDLVVVGTFLTLWVQSWGAEHGLTAAQALAKGGMIAGISQTAAFVWAPVIGKLSDRMNRVSALALALALAAAGYSSMGLVTDPTGGLMIAAVCLVGVGEISALITSQVLIGQQAPLAARGSVLGVFGLFGALGILLATKVGGHLFDDVSPAGPFVLMGGLNGALLIWALAVRKKVRAPADHTITDAVPSDAAAADPALTPRGEPAPSAP